MYETKPYFAKTSKETRPYYMKPSKTVKLDLLFMQVMESAEAVSYSFPSP